jgi:hypothetical protein
MVGETVSSPKREFRVPFQRGFAPQKGRELIGSKPNDLAEGRVFSKISEPGQN